MTKTDISKALKIDGWMSPQELTWLAQKASMYSRIVEIGSWMGRSTTVLAQHTPGKVWAVDTWEGSEELLPLLKDKPPNWLYGQFLDNLRGLLDKVVVIRGTSLEGSKTLSNLQFDMIFIDASHDYANVKQDIEAWRPLCRPGGLLCGHDYSIGWPGVKQAVDEYFPSFGKIKELSQQFGPPDWNDNSIWFTILS